MITKAQYNAWLADPDATRIALVEAGALIDGVQSTIYLSTGSYATKANELPASQVYLALLTADDLTVSEALSLTGEQTAAAGEVAIRNPSGELDVFMPYVWKNQFLRIYWGDPSWPRADFNLRFNGVTEDLGHKGQDFSLKLRDKLQRLNTAVSEVKLGGSTTNKDAVVPVGIGELENITPLLTDAATLEYQYDIGPSEGVGEPRDNGIPVAFTETPATGKFKLLKDPVGAITCSAQGQKPGGTYITTVAAAVRHLAANFGKASDRFNVTTALVPGRYDFVVEQLATFARASTATYINSSGNIATASAGAARVDYSGDAAVLIEAAAANLVPDSSTFSASYWAGCTVTANAEAYRGIAYKSIAKALASNNEACSVVLGSVATGTARTFTIALRAGTSTSVDIGLHDEDGTVWGSHEAATAKILEGSGTLERFTGALWRLSDLTSTNTLLQITRTYAATGTAKLYIYPGQWQSDTVGHSVLATRVQVEAGLVPSSYIPTTAGAVTRAADVATAWEDLDIASLAAFDAAHPQQIGLYMPDRVNVISACQQLASSIGAQVNLSRRGWLRLLKIDFTSAVSTFDIRPEHMVESSLTPVQRTEVVATVKLGFCQEWTEQPGLLTGLSAADKELFATKWLTATAPVDTAVQAAYKLSSDPVQEDTLLLRRVDADAEALRRRNLRRVQRTVYQFDGYAEMAQLDLGQIVTLYHPRFNLAAGSVGVVVSLKSKGAGSRVTVGVLT